MRTVTATFHDGSKIEVEISGSGPAVLLPVNPKPAEGKEAEEKRKWGMDPALGRTLIDGLNDAFTVVAFDYEGHLDEHPQADTLTPENIAHDILAVADAAGVKQFAYYGYSWLAVGALQLAIRTERLWAIVMGGWPPIKGSYKDMLTVTKATYEMTVQPKTHSTKPKTEGEFDWESVEIIRTEPQTRQFMTMYEALQSFDDRTVQSKITCPKLCFAGSADKIVYGERWDNAVVDIAGPLMDNANELRSNGWDIKVLDGLDHTGAMQPTHVLPIVRPWLISHAPKKNKPRFKRNLAE